MTIHIAKERLAEIVKTAFENYFNESKSDELYFSENQNYEIEPYSFLNQKNEYFKAIIEEGLTMSYPFDNVKNILIKRFRLPENAINAEEYNDGGNKTFLINVFLDKNVTKQTVGDIINTLEQCGYIKIDKSTQNNTRCITFEPKFTKDISEYVREKCKYLFHMTSTTLLDKISRIGLVPKSKNSIFMYPDRTYCMLGDKLTPSQVSDLNSVRTARNNTMPQLRNKSDNLQYCLLVIDVSKIPNDVKMYLDPMSSHAIFTYDNIPPSAIKEVMYYDL